MSFTIERQRAAAHQFVRSVGGNLLEEIVVQENSKRLTSPVNQHAERALSLAMKARGRVIVMGYRGASKWRTGDVLFEFIDRHRDLVDFLEPDDILQRHFALHRKWDTKPEKLKSRKTLCEINDISVEAYYDHLRMQLQSISGWRDMRPAEISAALNERGFLTYKGRRWRPDLARKAMPHILAA